MIELLDVDGELDRQVELLLCFGYARVLAKPPTAMTKAVEALRDDVLGACSTLRGEAAPPRVPLVLVVSGAAAPPEKLTPLSRLVGSPLAGVVDRNHGALVAPHCSCGIARA